MSRTQTQGRGHGTMIGWIIRSRKLALRMKCYFIQLILLKDEMGYGEVLKSPKSDRRLVTN